jgi:hypothetical protein
MDADLCVNENGDNAVSICTLFLVLPLVMMHIHIYIRLVLRYDIIFVRSDFIFVKFCYGVYTSTTKSFISGMLS